ncbi:hypothetical protein H6770_04140 [Candidatus Peribacteria bacterium]|nr:hypothetical protein [Candidatus Peribacteria bacterium]
MFINYQIFAIIDSDMTDFAQQVASAENLSLEDQKKAGAPVAGSMDEEHKSFLKTLQSLLASGEIDPYDPKSFLKMDIYNTLDEAWQDKADLSLQNIAGQVRIIAEFMASKETPDESPQLQTMVEQLWQSKQQIEKHHDVFKF